MKTILLWDPRFPDRRPARLTVEDTVASAAVRAGVAAAANPAEAGALSTGGALDPGMLTEVALQHGSGSAIRRVFIPYSVALVGAAAGVLAAVGTPIAGGIVLPTLTLTGPLTYSTTTAQGVTVFNIGNVPAGVTPVISPNDGRVVLAGDALNGWKGVRGMSAATEGSTTYSVAATGANGASVGVTVVASGVTLLANGARLVAFGDSITQQYSAGFALGNTAAGKSNLGSDQSDIGWALRVDPRFRFDNWPDVTITDGTSGFIRYTQGANQGVSGENTSQVLGRVQAWIAANRTWDGWVLNGPGINDINGAFNIPLATTQANIKAAVDALVATGKPGILAPPRPQLRATYTVDTAAVWAWMQTTFGAGTAYTSKVILVDYQAPFRADGPVADDFRDSDLHPGSYGAQANALGRDLSIPASSLLGGIRQLVNAGNLFTSDLWPRASLGTNPTFTGTSGLVAAGVTGTAPTGFGIVRANGTSTTAVASVMANADTGGQSIVLTITPVGTSNNESFRCQLQTALSGAAATALQNTWVQLVAEVEIDGNPILGSIYAEISCSDTAYIARSNGTGASATNATAGKNRGALRYYLMTEPMLMPATLTSVQTALYVKVLNALGTTAGVAKLHRMKLVAISDPRPGYGF